MNDLDAFRRWLLDHLDATNAPSVSKVDTWPSGLPLPWCSGDYQTALLMLHRFQSVQQETVFYPCG